MLQGVMFLAWAWLRDDIRLRGPLLGDKGNLSWRKKISIFAWKSSIICAYSLYLKYVSKIYFHNMMHKIQLTQGLKKIGGF